MDLWLLVFPHADEGRAVDAALLVMVSLAILTIFSRAATRHPGPYESRSLISTFPMSAFDSGMTSCFRAFLSAPGPATLPMIRTRQCQSISHVVDTTIFQFNVDSPNISALPFGRSVLRSTSGVTTIQEMMWSRVIRSRIFTEVHGRCMCRWVKPPTKPSPTSVRTSFVP